MSSDNGSKRLFNSAIQSTHSNPDSTKGSSKSTGGSGSSNPGVVKDMVNMRGRDSLETQPITFGKSTDGSKSRRDDKSHGSIVNGAAGSGWSISDASSTASASGSNSRLSSHPRTEREWEGDPVPIHKPTGNKPSQQHHGSGQPRRSSAVSSPYTPGANNLNKKPVPPPTPSRLNPRNPTSQFRNASNGFSVPPSTIDPTPAMWGVDRGQKKTKATGQEWLGDLDGNRISSSRPTSNQQGTISAGPSTSTRQPQASASSRLSTSQASTSATSKISNPPSRDQKEEVAVSDSESEGPLQPRPPTKNAVAGPSKPKLPSAGASIDRARLKQNYAVERPPPPPPPSKPQQQIHEVSSDDDDVTEFSQAEELAIASGRPLPPGSSSSSRRPPPLNSSSSRPEPTSAGVITKPPRSSTDYSAQGSKLPLPPFKRKEKAQLEGEADDESARALSASTSTSTNVGDVKRKVAAMNAAAQPLPMKPAPATGGVMKRMRGKGGQLVVSPPANAASSSTAKRAAPTERGEPGLKTFPISEWWKGFSKQAGRSNLQIGGGSFQVGTGKNACDIELPFAQIMRMRFSTENPFLVSLELSDDGDRDKIIPHVTSTTKHDYAKISITFLFSPQKSDELLTFLSHEFGQDRTTIQALMIDRDESELLYNGLRKAMKPKPKPATTVSHPFSLPTPSGSNTRNTRSSVGGATTTVTELDASDDDPELIVAKPKTRAPRPPCVNPTEVMATWPLTGKGQFDITKGDYHRTLDDVEFLNDTMIEYGLRSALSEAIKTMPELAEDVHIFSTFLYTKLSNKKKAKDGGDPWEVVARWTRKFDIFKKKFLIVPINEDFHWYLAIIVNPGAVLRPPEVKIPPEPTTATRSRTSSGGSHIDVDAPSLPHLPAPLSQQQLSESHVQHQQNAEAGPSRSNREDEIEEVEQALATSNDTRHEQEDVVERVGRQHQLKNVTMQEVEGSVRNLSLERLAAEGDDVEMKESNEDATGGGSDEKEKATDATALAGSSTQPTTETVSASSTEHGYIFTLDSLGSAHPAAGKLLNRYLASEAKNRKQLPFEPTPLTTKKLDVPTQPDYSSCGVYMIHYVECLFRDPEGVVALGGADSRLKAVAQKRDTLWRKSELPDARKRLKESVDGLVEAWKAKRLEEEGSSSEPAKAPVAGEAAAPSVAPPPKPSEEKPPVVAASRAQASTSTSVQASSTNGQHQDQDQQQQESTESSKVDKGKGREVPLNTDQYQAVSSPTKGPNPFGPSKPESEPKKENPFVRTTSTSTATTHSPTPLAGPPFASTPFHFGANPPPSQFVASLPPPPPSQPRPSPPTSQPSKRPTEWKPLVLEPSRVEDEFDEIDSSDSEDFRDDKDRKADQQLEVVEDFAHGQLEARGKVPEKESERLPSTKSCSVASDLTDPPFQPVSRHPSPPPLPTLPLVPPSHESPSSSSHQPPPTFRALAPSRSQQLEAPRSQPSSRRPSPAVFSRENSRPPPLQCEAPATSHAKEKSVLSSPPPEHFVPSEAVGRVRSAPSAPSRSKAELAARSSSDVHVELPSHRNGNGSGNGSSHASGSRSSGKRSAESNQDHLRLPPSKKANLNDSNLDTRTFYEKFAAQDPLNSATAAQTARPSSQFSKATKKAASSSNASEAGGSRKGSSSSSNGSKPSSQQSKAKPSSQTNFSTEAEASQSSPRPVVDDDDQEDDPLHLSGEETSRFFPPSSQPSSKRKTTQEPIPEDEEADSDPLESTTSKKRKTAPTKKETEKERKLEAKKLKDRADEEKKEEVARKAKEDEIDLTKD